MLRLDRDNPNTFVGVILLVVLLVFVLPERLPTFVTDISPYFIGGIPCGRLPAASNLAAHQSILGRSAVDPLQLEITSSEISGEAEVIVRLAVTNMSLGSVPIVYQEDNIVVAGADDESDGFGIIIDPPPSAGTVERINPNPPGYEEADIRILGPRQTCLFSVEVAAAASMIADGGTASAHYRMTGAGEHQQQIEGTRQIYPDQGLAILSEGLVVSDEIDIEPRS